MDGGTVVLYGSVLHMLVHKIMPGTPQENMTALWARVRQLYNHFRIPKENRYGTLRLTMFKLTGTTKLRGKAGEIRAFGRVIHRLWQQNMNSEVIVHRKIEACLDLGCKMEAILDDNRELFAFPGVFF